MERWKEDFIIGLRQGKPVDVCARILAGRSLSQVYDAREDDPVFAEIWDKIVPIEDISDGLSPIRVLSPGALEALMWSQCSDEEAAAYFGLELGEFKKTVAENPKLSKAYKLGPLGGKAALKRAQFEGAMSGDKTMQTWVGKQILGQSDKVDTTVTHKKEDLSAEELAKRLLYIMSEAGIESPKVIDGEVIKDDPLPVEKKKDEDVGL